MTALIAHRGASAEAPENTLAAIRRAVELKVDYIEVDIHITKDEIPILIHDSTLTRTTNIEGVMKVEELTLKELKALDAGSWFGQNYQGEEIPTLQELLELDLQETKLMLEVKKGVLPPKKMIDIILNAIPSSMEKSILIGSFEIELIQELLKEKFPLIGIVEKPQYIDEFLKLGIKHLALWTRLLEPNMVEKFHEQDIVVWIYTVDDIKTAHFLKSIGVDGIITNHPLNIRQKVFESPFYLL